MFTILSAIFNYSKFSMISEVEVFKTFRGLINVGQMRQNKSLNAVLLNLNVNCFPRLYK